MKLAEGPVQEMVGTGLPCAVQLNVAWRDWFTVRSIGGPRMKGWAGWMGGGEEGEEVADSESGRYTECVWEEEGGKEISGCHKKLHKRVSSCIWGEVCITKWKVLCRSFSFTTILGSNSQKTITSAVLLAVSTTFSAVHV